MIVRHEESLGNANNNLTVMQLLGGHFQKEIMKDFVQLYIELLVVVDPTISLRTIYSTKIQERLASDLDLQNDEVLSMATISHFLLSQNIMRKKCKKVA